ncbi:hypothetical protein [Gloeothece verrucosa]|uniref:Uncharacterized protein n=1 Tax=Gloeothece verrucosa (strain PCC 7822) TaxID=497965 RepID=E0UFW4_GLOV7|nr:hypothetical protein [Gloeothece verrucosa]ADN14347.1 hypothetical protein Cyan7822_2371 [Gloeothece verrucosa PCC 7822]
MKVEAKFTSQEAAHNAQNAIQSAGLPLEKISLETQSFIPRTEIRQTQTLKNASTAAVTGGVLGGMIGFFLSLVNSNVPGSVTFVADHSERLMFLITLAGSIIGAAGFGLIGAITGINVPKNVPNAYRDKAADNYLLVVEGNEEQVQTVTEILKQQGGQLA